MIYHFLLSIHIAAGSSALATGLVAMLTKKGSAWHKRAGRVFAVCLLLSCLTAVGLSLLKPNPMLMAIGAFTFYLVASGWCYAHGPGQAFRIAGVLGIVSAGGLVVQWFEGAAGARVVLSVFILIQSWLAVSDFKLLKDPQDRIRRHIGRMGGAYIAAMTAFLVVSVQVLPWYVAWFAPTLAGAVGIRHALGRQMKKDALPVIERPRESD